MIENALSILDASVHAAAEPSDTTPGVGAVIVNTVAPGGFFIAKLPRIDNVDAQELFGGVLKLIARTAKMAVVKSTGSHIIVAITETSASQLRVFMDDVARNKFSEDIRVGRVCYDASKSVKHIPDYNTASFEDADKSLEFPGYVYAAVPNSSMLWTLMRVLASENSPLLGDARVQYGASSATGSHYILVLPVLKGKPQVKASDLPRIEARVGAAKEELRRVVADLNMMLGSIQIFHATAAYKLGEAL